MLRLGENQRENEQQALVFWGVTFGVIQVSSYSEDRVPAIPLKSEQGSTDLRAGLARRRSSRHGEQLRDFLGGLVQDLPAGPT